MRTENFIMTLRCAIKRIGLNELLYDTHSFRIGRATDLFENGTSVEDIMKIG